MQFGNSTISCSVKVETLYYFISLLKIRNFTVYLFFEAFYNLQTNKQGITLLTFIYYFLFILCKLQLLPQLSLSVPLPVSPSMCREIRVFMSNSLSYFLPSHSIVFYLCSNYTFSFPVQCAFAFILEDLSIFRLSDVGPS